MPTEDKDLSAVREEHLERILESYGAKSKEFQRVFHGLIIFALVFFFVILLPYISLQIEDRQISDELNGLRGKIESIEMRHASFEQARDGIQELHEQIKGGPEALREYILFLEKECASGESFVQQSVCPTDKAERDVWFDQKVQERIQEQLAHYQEIVTEGVVTPLQSMSGDAGSIDLAGLTDGLNNLQSVFATKLAENPGFWRKFELKVDFYAQLDQALGGVWSKYDALIQAEGEKLESELASLEDEKTQSEERQSQLKSEEEKIVGRLDQIEFPFGKFPVGLKESAAVFPLLLAIGFFVCASLLCETIRARRSFHHFYQQKDPSRQILSDQQVALVAPLPIDPMDREQNQAIQFAMLSIPLVVFIAACGLTLYSWTIPGVSSSVRIFEWIYGGLYVFSLGLFAYGYRRVITELRRYGGNVRHASVDKA